MRWWSSIGPVILRHADYVTIKNRFFLPTGAGNKLPYSKQCPPSNRMVTSFAPMAGNGKFTVVLNNYERHPNPSCGFNAQPH
jgi:hypothetical protein